MVFVKPVAHTNPAFVRPTPIVENLALTERMRMIARWHNEYGTNASDRRDRQRHFAIAKKIEIFYGQG